MRSPTNIRVIGKYVDSHTEQLEDSRPFSGENLMKVLNFPRVAILDMGPSIVIYGRWSGTNPLVSSSICHVLLFISKGRFVA